MDAVERDIFGSQEIAYECLADVERTKNFLDAINQVVKKDDQVMEMGTGTGVLSLFAAKAGARSVHAFEIVKPMADIARQNIRANGLQDVVAVYDGDVTKAEINQTEFYDVLIAEMISVGLIEEQLVPAFNNVLQQKVLKNDAQVMPCANETFAELVDTDFTHFGVNLRTIQIEQTWQDSKIKNVLTDRKTVSYVDFNNAVQTGEQIKPQVDTTVTFVVAKAGTVNALRLTSDSILSSSVVSGWTQCMNSPAVIPINEFDVTEGQEVVMRITYEMGGEMSSFTAERI